MCSHCLSFHPQRMGILNVGQRVEEQTEFEKIYKTGTAVCSAHLACVLFQLKIIPKKFSV